MAKSSPQIPSAAKQEAPRPRWEGTDGIDACRGPTGKIPSRVWCLSVREGGPVCSGREHRLPQRVPRAILRSPAQILAWCLIFRRRPTGSSSATTRSDDNQPPPPFPAADHSPHWAQRSSPQTRDLSPRRSASRCRGCTSSPQSCAIVRSRRLCFAASRLGGREKREAV